MKIAYAGYDVLSDCLFALEQAGAQVMAVYTCPTDGRFEHSDRVRAFAAQRGLTCPDTPLTPADLAGLRAAGCQALFSAGYYYRIPVDPALPGVNVHPALLPQGRGAWPLPVQILREDTRGGVTLHKLVPQWDAGDILLQQDFALDPREDLETLTAKVNAAAAALCRRVVKDFARLWEQAVPQGVGSYWACPQKPDYTITAATDPRQTDRILRAFYGFDCYLQTPEAEYQLVGGRFRPLAHAQPFGTRERTPAGTRYFVNGGVIELPPEGSCP